MTRTGSLFSTSALLLAAATSLLAQAPKQPPSPAQGIRNQFGYINQKILEMAKDFPEDKYEYKLKPEMRSFRELIVHILSGNVYATKIGKGEKAQWDEVDAKLYPSKATAVAAMEKSITESTAVLKGLSDDRFKETLAPWLSVIEHSAEHYGLLVAYYRSNGLVPPESRPKK
jgi:uncharacterized damage-inducible protein DinB